MQNIEVEEKGGKLIITVDLTKSFGPSASQKSIIIASTEGNQKVAKTKKGDAVVMGLTVYTKNPDAPKAK